MDILKFERPAPQPDGNPDTIDVLILRSLFHGGVMDAKSIAKQWGEDEVRVRGFLTKFVKDGIVAVRPLNGGKSVGFHADQDAVRDYMKAKENRAS